MLKQVNKPVQSKDTKPLYNFIQLDRIYYPPYLEHLSLRIHSKVLARIDNFNLLPGISTLVLEIATIFSRKSSSIHNKTYIQQPHNCLRYGFLFATS